MPEKTVGLIRLRLLRSLQAALQSGHALITAPAGYGKTALLRSLATHQPHTYYFPLTPADTDRPHLRKRLREALHPAGQRTRTTLLLDDVHHLEKGPEVLDWLVEQLQGDTPRLVLAGRWVPSPAVWNEVVRGKLAHLDANDLAFTLTESQSLLAQHDAYPTDWTAAWHRHSGGWPLALALLTRVRAAPNPAPAAKTELFDYLAHTLAGTLPPPLLRFWTITAVPLRFNNELAAFLLDGNGDAVALRQEIQHHNLFLEPAGSPGWFHYHELIREFLLRQTTEDLTPIYRKVIAWFRARDDLEMAIEHALAGELQDDAARLILQLPPGFTKIEGRVWTFRRWIMSLSDDVQMAYPELLIRMASSVHETGGWPEAPAYREKVRRVSEAAADPAIRRRALQALAMLHFRSGEFEESLAVLNSLLADPTSDDAFRAQAIKTTGDNLAGLGRLGEASQAYDRATALAESVGNEALAMYARHNHIVLVLIPLGAFERARALMERNAAYISESRPYEIGAYLMEWCELAIATGDWDDLATKLAQFEALAAQLEEQIDDDAYWLCSYRGLLETGRGRFAGAQDALERAAGFAGDDPLSASWLAAARSWLLRRQGRDKDAARLAEEALAQPAAWPAYVAALVLERDIALAKQDTPLHQGTTRLITLRARPHLVRLRALLALRCFRQADPRWRRHARAALSALKRPGYEHLLTQRDPDLGAPFWAMLLAEGVAVSQAAAGLQVIGDPQPVLPILQHTDPATRSRAAQSLAAIGDEQAMPGLTTALAAERDRPTKAALKKALLHLESRSPPPLKVKLLGDFALWRSDELVPADAWYRPVVRRLFQYFALHRGLPLSRDRILEDLWPDAVPQKGYRSFRTVYSRLRKVLEPYMRTKGPCRYVSIQEETYRFDPYGVVQVDAVHFESLLHQTLKSAEEHDMPPLQDELLDALETWSPLLPDLPYEDWLLESRERLQGLYVEGCLYVARALLMHGRPAEATRWAERSVSVAPWLEEGYRALMRAYARQGQRSLALKAYEDAVAALERELDVPPAPLTHWLAERLRQGEEI